jgi:uncharacterized peroxidase-related enzyme
VPHVLPLPSCEAPPEVRAIYDEFRSRMLFPEAPNFLTTQGHSRTVARGTWELVRSVLVTGDIPRWQKEMIFAAISRDRDCHYCEAAHFACCRNLGVTPDLLESLVRDIHAITDAKLRDMILFSIKCSREPQQLETVDYDVLRQHGLTQAEIIELIGMSALAVYANIIADATCMESDEMFGKL